MQWRSVYVVELFKRFDVLISLYDICSDDKALGKDLLPELSKPVPVNFSKACRVLLRSNRDYTAPKTDSAFYSLSIFDPARQGTSPSKATTHAETDQCLDDRTLFDRLHRSRACKSVVSPW